MTSLEPRYAGTGTSVAVNRSMLLGEGDRWVEVETVLPSASIADVLYQIVHPTTKVVVLSYELSTQPTYFDVTEDYKIVVKLQNDDTEGLAENINYLHACQVEDVSGNIYTPQYGTFTFVYDVIQDANPSTPHLTWQTRDDLDTAITARDTFITDMMTVAQITQISTNASAGAGSITVDNVGNIGDTDTIWIQNNNDAYEEHVVNGAPVGSDITLTGTLAAAADAGNFVRLI